MALDDLKNRIAVLQAFDCKQEVLAIVTAEKQKLVDSQRDQLLSGLDNEGNYIRPFYSENPYFKTKAKALRYAWWKKSFHPERGRPLDVPNLFITGRYHGNIFVLVQPNLFELKSNDPNARAIESVHTKALGLNQVSKMDFAINTFLPLFKKAVMDKTGLEIKSK